MKCECGKECGIRLWCEECTKKKELEMQDIGNRMREATERFKLVTKETMDQEKEMCDICRRFHLILYNCFTCYYEGKRGFYCGTCKNYKNWKAKNDVDCMALEISELQEKVERKQQKIKNLNERIEDLKREINISRGDKKSE